MRMKESVHLVPVVLDWVIITGCVFLIFYAFDNRRIRARWASCILIASGLIGVAAHVLSLMLDMHWLMLSRQADYGFHVGYFTVNGIILGWLFALIFSGQLSGSKRT